MASAAAEDLKPLKKNSSFDWLPPRLSELRVVLLGNSWSLRSSVGNFILEKTEFNTEQEANQCLKISGQVKEKKVVLINTPDLLHPNISLHELTKHVKNCVRLSAPGPHVFLLVLQAENFTEKHKEKLQSILTSFSDRSFDHSLVLISTSREESSDFKDHPPLKDLIRQCRYRSLRLKDLEPSELLTRLGQTVKENNGAHVSCDVFDDEDAGLFMTPKFESEHMKAALNLVLCGRRGAGKTSAAKAILGVKELHSVSNSSECVKHQGEVCGRGLSLVELPALYGKPQQEVMEESFRCISLCDPEGVHAFILVLPVGSLTDEDKGELKIIQNIFSSRVDDFTMILFTVDSDPEAPAVVKFMKGNKEIQELLQSCGGRSSVLNMKNKQQIPELLEAVEKIRAEGSRCFTKDMFTKAQMEKVWKLQQKTDDEIQCLTQERVETILRETEEEMKRKEEELKRKHEEELKEVNKKLNEQIEEEAKLKATLMEKNEFINKEQQKREREWEEEEKRWQKILETSEKIVQSEKKHWETSEKNLEEWREEMKTDRDALDKERKDLWKQIREEDKQRLEEEKTSYRKLQAELQRKRLTDVLIYFGFALLLPLLLFFLYYVFQRFAYTHTADGTNTKEHT